MVNEELEKGRLKQQLGRKEMLNQANSDACILFCVKCAILLEIFSVFL